VRGRPGGLRRAELAAPLQSSLQAGAWGLGRGDTTCGRVLVHVASVSDVSFRMLQVFRVDVAKVDLDVSVLSMLIPDVVDVDPRCCNYFFQMMRMLQLFLAYFLMLQTLILDVATCVVGCCKYFFSMLQMLRFDVADM
jgi:hypothetical protein